MRSLLLVLFVFLTSCSLPKSRTEEPQATLAAVKTSTEQSPAPAAASNEPTMTTEATASAEPAKEEHHADAPQEKTADLKHLAQQDVQIVLKDAKGKIVKTDISSSSAHSNEAHAHGRKAGSVSAEKAIGWLVNGNKRFTSGRLRKDGQSKKDVRALAQAQKPHTIVLSCSDSRVPPELVFDQKLGEIFVVRTAGPNLDPAVIASIEYATEHLGPNLILVMGHTSCGAVRAALGTMNGGDAGSPALNSLVSSMHPRLADFSEAKHSELYHKEGLANATGVAKELLEKSALIRQAVESGSLKVKTALYHTESGVVEF